MKKRGFTLVEMLAVLVLVVALSLVVFPSIISYINSSKGDISDVTKEMILSNVKLYVSDNKNTFSKTLNNTYCLTVGDLMDKNYLDDTFKDSVSGEEIDRDKKIKVQYIYDNDLKTNIFKYDLDDNCTPISIICSAKEIPTNGNKAEGNYNYGDEYSCELGDGESKTFYVLENNDDTVSLIMNMNVGIDGKGTTSGNTVAWVSQEDYIAAGGDDLSNDGLNCQYGGICSTIEFGPITANNYLKNSTNNWKKLNSSQISLPTYDQISQSYSGSMPTWLYENLSVNDSAPYSYWTSAPSASNSSTAWRVYHLGTLSLNSVDNDLSIGVRPVITISKTEIFN